MKSLAIILLLCCSVIFITEAIVSEETVTEEFMPGGLHRIRRNDLDMLKAFLPFERKLDQLMNSTKIHRVVRIRRAYSQVVSGIKYYVDFDFHDTNCLKGSAQHLISCKITGSNHNCHAEIWLQPWVGPNKLVNFECKN